MKAYLSIFLVFVGAAANAGVSKVDCVIYKSTLPGNDILSNGKPVTMDLSKAVEEGAGPSVGLGQVGSTPMNFQIYLSDKTTSEFTLQINEGVDIASGPKSGIVLGSSILNQSGPSKILYRAPGSMDYVIVVCNPEI